MKFTNCKTKQAMAAADVNSNGIINSDLKLKVVVEYAQKHWGLTIVKNRG